MARADGSLRSLLAYLSCIDVLVIDDGVVAPLSKPERRDCWENCGDRYQASLTKLTSRRPVSRWHEQIGDPTLADGILSTGLPTGSSERRLDAQESPKGERANLSQPLGGSINP